MRHDDYEELAALAALDLLEGEELARWKAHRSECESCRASGQSFAEAASTIPLGLDPVKPPDEVRRKILRELRGPVREPRTLAPLITAVAALIIIGVAGVFLFLQQRDLRNEIEHLRTREEMVASENRRLISTTAELSSWIAAMTSREAKEFHLQGLEAAPSAEASVYMDPSSRTALIFFSGLQRPEKDQQYQLWIIRKGEQPEGAGTFEVSEEGTARLRLENLPVDEEIEAMAVTIEPHGGRAAPSGDMVLLGKPST